MPMFLSIAAGFSVEAGTNSLNAIKVPTAGTYAIEYSLFVQDVVSAGSAARDVILADIVVIRAGSIVSDLTSRWSKYFRAQDDTDAIYLSGTHTVDLQADDEIELLVYMDTASVATWIVGGGQSEISIVRVVGTPTVEGIDAGVGYGSWTNIGTITGAISSAAVTVALDTDQSIDDYEEMFIHIEANDANDQRSVSPRFRTEDIPETTLAGGGLIVGFPGNNTDEGAILIRRNADGDSLVLDPHGSVISFPATAVTTIVARSFVASDGTDTAGQTSSGVLTRVSIHSPPSDPFALTTTPTSSALSVGNENQIFFPAVEKARVERVVLVLRIDDTYNVIADISKEEMDRIPARDVGRPDPIVGTDDSGCHYLSGRTQISADSREPLISNPTWAYVDFRRLANRYGICIWFSDDSTTLRWRKFALHTAIPTVILILCQVLSTTYKRR